MKLDGSDPAQVGVYADRQSEANRLGIGPAWEIVRDEGPSGQWKYLLVGRCERLPDATLLKRELRKLGFSGAYERAFPELVDGDFSTQVNGVEVFPPLREMPASLPPWTESSPEAVVIIGQLRSFPGFASEKSARSLLAVLDDSNPAKGVVMSELAKSMIIARIPHEQRMPGKVMAADDLEAVDGLFNDLLWGAVVLPEEVYLDAAWNYATFVHEVRQDRFGAYRLYTSILRYGQDDGCRARALVMLAACTMELANSQAAYFNETRRLCETVLQTVPMEYGRARSVAMLMDAESYYFEKQYDEAAQRLLAVVSDPRAHIREALSARYMASKCYVAMGKKEEALALLLQNLEYEPELETSFFWAGSEKNVVASSAAIAKSLAKEVGTGDLIDQIADLEGIMRKRSTELPPEDSFFPDRIYQLQDAEVVARASEGGLDHACVCPQTIETHSVSECAHFTVNPGEVCRTNQCSYSTGEVSYCSVNPNAPNPNGNDCPTTFVPVAHRSQYLYQKTSGDISGCSTNDPTWGYFPSVVQCLTKGQQSRCEIPSCGGSGYTLIDQNLNQVENIARGECDE